MRFDEPRFNDDLLLEQEDRQRAARHYPSIIHVLDHPELRTCFQEFDARANLAKRRSRRLGSLAIILATIAILGASAEIIFANKDDVWLRVIAVVASLCGICGVIVGAVGVLFGRTKREWLHLRFMGERLRQYHFQSFIVAISDIATSLQDEKAKANFLSARQRSFEDIRAEIEPKLAALLTDVIEKEVKDFWLHKVRDGESRAGERQELEPLFSAYRELRIRHQLNYANYKLRNDHRIFSDAARRQLSVLGTVVIAGITLLFVIHVLIAVGIAVNTSFSALLVPNHFNVAIIWIATFALAARAFEQGLQPEREIERHQQYRSAIQAMLERFDNARTQTQKLRIMRHMEQLAFDEMRNFLITHERSHFVM